MRGPYMPGGFGFAGIFADVMAGLIFIICFAVVVGLLVVIVRFLLAATKAADLYVAKNSPAAPTTPVAPAPAGPTSPLAPSPAATSTTPTSTVATKPLPRTRTPKTPPPV